MRKFALSSSVFHRHQVIQAIRHVALAGYPGIEVVADAPHGYPPTVTQSDRTAIRTALSQHRMTVSNVDASPMTALRDEARPSWTEPDKVLRHERLQHTLEAAKLAKDIGGLTLSTLAGGEIDPEMTRDQAVKHFVSGLVQAAAVIAKRQYPPILIDPKPGLIVHTAEQARQIVEQIKSPHVGVNFNTGHFHRSRQDLAASIRDLKTQIRHVHIEDVAADHSGIVVPGTGAVDFAAVFQALDHIGYDGWLTVDLSGADVHPDEAARIALQFLGQFDK